jgi:hypothetical protein
VVAGVLLKMEPVCLVDLEEGRVVLELLKQGGQQLLVKVMWVEIPKTPGRCR